MISTLQKETTVRNELSSFYRDNGFGEDGGKQLKFAKIKMGWFSFYIPNTESRKKALFFHDVHHLATGYGTDLCGEAEISAWEIGSGCGNFWAAWVLDSFGLIMGIFIAPRRTWRAFWLGRKCRNLYHGLMAKEEIMGANLNDIRILIGFPSQHDLGFAQTTTDGNGHLKTKIN